MIEDNEVFVNKSSCSFYRIPCQQDKNLQTISKTRNTYISSGVVSIKISRSSNLNVTSVDAGLKTWYNT